MRLRRILLASAAMAAFATGGFAATFNVTADPPTGNNAFQAQLNAVFGVGNLAFGYLNSVVAAAGGETLTFTKWGSESGFTNTFTADNGSSSVSLTEIGNEAWGVGGSAQLDFSGALASSALKFTGTSGAVPAEIGDIGMGVYYDATGTSDFLFLAYDDGGGSNDDNHDDFLVKVEKVDTSVVPLPAAGWLMVAGLGGLAALRRKKKAA